MDSVRTSTPDIFIPIPWFVFENMSPELKKFVKALPNHKRLADYCKPSEQLKYYKQITKNRVHDSVHM